MSALHLQQAHPTDTAGRMITPRRMRRGLLLVTLAGSMGCGFWAVVPGMPLVMLLEELNASGVLIGLLGTLFQLGLIIQIPSTFFLESLNRRKGFWVFTALMSRAVFFIPAFAMLFLSADRAAWIIAIITVTTAVSALHHHASIPPWLSWMADLVPAHRRGRYWGQRQIFFMTAFLLFNAVIGAVLDRSGNGQLTGFTIVLFIAAIVGSADIVFHAYVPEPRVEKTPRGGPTLKRLLAPMKNRDFMLLTAAMACFMFGMGFTKPFGDVYLKRAFELPYSHLAALQIAISLGSIAAGWVCSMLTDRIGARPFALILLVLMPFFHLFWFFLHPGDVSVPFGFAGLTSLPQPTVLLFGGILLRGMIGSSFMLSYMSLMAALTEEKGRSMAMAVHSSLVGIPAALGPLAGGMVMDFFEQHPLPLRISAELPFSFYHVMLIIHMLLMWGVILPLMLNIRKMDRETKMPAALRSVIFANPTRLFRNLYNMYVVSSNVSHERRAKAVYHLGRGRNEIAVRDLIDSLHDASSEVREQSVYALGRIGTPEAVEALMEKLQDPHSDMGPQIARALRRVRSPKTVDALLEKLQEPDRETQSESARTLGEIGDRRASDSLIQLLRDSREDKIIGASSDALARLGELAAIYEILPHMKNTRNPVLKRSLAVAVGDLLGPEHEFYKLLNVEIQDPMSSAEQLIGDLRKAIQRDRRLTRDAGRMIRKLHEIEQAYMAEQFRESLEQCGYLALHLAAAIYGIEHGDNAHAVTEELVWRNQKTGIMVWMLFQLLERTDDDPDVERIETLLGLYALSRWEE